MIDMRAVYPIDRDALQDAVFGYLAEMGIDEWDVIRPIRRIIQSAPTLDYEPVRQGEWEWYEEPYDSEYPDGDYGWRCSCCKQDLAAELTHGIPGMHYAYDVLDDPDNPPTIKRCLFCGARMKED